MTAGPGSLGGCLGPPNTNPLIPPVVPLRARERNWRRTALQVGAPLRHTAGQTTTVVIGRPDVPLPSGRCSSRGGAVMDNVGVSVHGEPPGPSAWPERCCDGT